MHQPQPATPLGTAAAAEPAPINVPQTGYTVPEHGYAVPRSIVPPGMASSAVFEIRYTNRCRFTVRVVTNFLITALFMTIAIRALIQETATNPNMPASTYGVLILPALFAIVTTLQVVGLQFVLRHPVIARFTDAGWEIPAKELSGSWSEISAIQLVPKVKPADRDKPYIVAKAETTVLLMVVEPERYLAGLPPKIAAMARLQGMRLHMTPATFSFTPKSTRTNAIEVGKKLGGLTSVPVSIG